MTTFDDRETGFENQFAHDAAFEFRVLARRNKLLGLWAAGLLGLDDDAAAAYARTVVQADLVEVGDDDVFRKVSADLTAGNVALDDGAVRAAMTATLVEARRQLMDAA